MRQCLRISTTLLILLASALACNLPAREQVPPPSDVQTSAALTVEALLTTPSATETAHQESKPILSETPTAGPTSTITPTYSTPKLTLREQTNCRAGPGQDYEVLFTYLKGAKLNIIGNYPQENYWLVVSKESPNGECWLWGEYADVVGSYWVVPSVTPPPTATPSLPQAPSVKWEFNCDYAAGQMTVAFTWSDHANNEAGYRVIRNNQSTIELPANSTAYTDSYLFSSGEKVLYQIEVYNVTGFTRSSVISVTC